MPVPRFAEAVPVVPAFRQVREQEQERTSAGATVLEKRTLMRRDGLPVWRPRTMF